MSTNIRNFRLDDETWEAFVTQCKADRSSASAELGAFVRAYVGGLRLTEGQADTSLSSRVDDLTAAVEDLRGKLAA